MAILMQEESNRLRCPNCSNNTFYEQDIYAYIITAQNTRSTDLESVLDHTRLICSKCNAEALRLSTASKIERKGDN